MKLNRKSKIIISIIVVFVVLLIAVSSIVRSRPSLQPLEDQPIDTLTTQTSLKGILRQDSYGFNLLTEAPEGSPDVSSSLSLTIKVSNALKDLVGKRVEVVGTLGDNHVFTVSELNPLSGNEGDATLGTVEVGKSVFINGVRITLNYLVSGATTANVTLKSDTDTDTVFLNYDKPPTAFDSFHVSIISKEGNSALFKVVNN